MAKLDLNPHPQVSEKSITKIVTKHTRNFSLDNCYESTVYLNQQTENALLENNHIIEYNLDYTSMTLDNHCYLVSHRLILRKVMI